MPGDEVPLRQYIEALLNEHEKRYDERMGAAKEAVETATKELNSRLELLNELRDNVLTRGEYDAKHQQLDGRIQGLEQWRANIIGRAIAFSVIGGIFIAVVVAVITHVLSVN